MTEIELNAEITLWDYGQCLGFILDLAASGLIVSSIQLGQSASSLSINLAGVSHGLATSTTALAGLTVGFTPRFLPGSNARWCVENWPLVSRL